MNSVKCGNHSSQKAIAIFTRALVVVGILFCSGMGFAQSLQIQSTGTTQPVQPDSIVQITAEAQGLTAVPYSNLPRGGTYWEVLPSGIAAPFPCPPLVSTLPIYGITGNIFLVDATGGQVAVNPRRLGMQIQTQITASAFNTALETLATSIVNLITMVQNPPATLAASPMMRTSMMTSSLSNSQDYGNQIYLANLTAGFANDGSMTVNFNIGGGTNFVPYDILMTTNLLTAMGNWNWIGIGYTSNNYTFFNQPSDNAFYRLAKPSKTMAVGWGGDIYGQADVPLGTNSLMMVSGGYGYSLGVLNNGTVIGWGNSSAAGWVPTNLIGNVTMVCAAWNHNVALLTNGTVVAWGFNGGGLGWHLTEVPTDLTNATVISAEAMHTLALRSNGTVVAWGYNYYGQTNVPAGLTNVTAIAAGGNHSLVVSNGFVVAWGCDIYHQCEVPANLSNVCDVAASDYHSLALRKDGTVVAWGDNSYGESTVPAGLTNVVAIAAGGSPNVSDPYMGGTPLPYSMALKNDGSLITWGAGLVNQPVQGINNVIGISGGLFHALAVRTGPPTPVITLEPTNQVQALGGNVSFSAKGQGLYGVTYQWQTNGVNLPGATSALLILTNVQMTQAGSYNVVVTDNGGMGSIVSSDASFSLVTSPTIVSQSPMPTNQMAPYQTNLALSVVATAPGQYNGFPLHYQWQFNGTNVGGNSTNYTLFVDTPTLGNYSVIVSNAVGSVTSLVWQVSMTYAGSYIDVGTLAYHLSTNATGRTNGFSSIYNATTEIANWNYGTYSNGNLSMITNSVWSTNFWLQGVQGLSATCLAISNSLGGQGCVTMISPRHCIYASHMHLPPGQFMAIFMDTNNVIYFRTNMQNVSITNDISVGILDSDLPPSINFLPVLPTNCTNYLPANGSSIVQGIGMNQGKQLFGQPMTFTPTGVSWNANKTAPFGVTTNWNVTIVGGDSSNPEMLLISNQLVLASHNYGYQGGPNYAGYFNAINQTMHYLSTNNGVGTDYQLTTVSLTNWPVINP